MNKRIRELAHEAGLPVYNPQGIPTKLEKFAELIVRECDYIMEKYGQANMESDAWVAMIAMMQKETKQHFEIK